MKYYRLENIYYFMVNDDFLYNEEIIGGTAISLKHKIYKIKDNKEFLFKSDNEELEEQCIGANGIYIHSYVKYYFNRDKIINIIIDKKGLEKIGFRVEYEINGYFKLVKNQLIEISKDEFCRIMKENIELFDISGNSPAQVIGYAAYEIK
ncbi:hypothetical protein FSCG_01000 [Fusobacterium vincentii 4_1_13]|uniref:Uncharacterized protein n=1 Tax=Fusobacterium vincentii 4_1_13 TaxID=469606 RepID=A0A0M1VUN2_FUSVC|nr:hypothetical protein [Fusobacterium vincentii]EEO40287.1 hypothetical protein FSCG_01000 [Fusobacterium vincentii 4_1_13]